MDIKIIINALTTLAAAFAGALAAFQLESNRKKRETIDSHISTVNRSLYTVFNLWNILYQFQNEVIEPVRNNDDAWLNMAATAPLNYGLTSFNAEELSFILNTPHANTYSELLLEEQRFWIAVHQIEMRSSIILNEVFPRFSAAGVPVYTSLSEQEIENIIGIDVVHKLKQLTENIIEHIDDNVKSLEAVHNLLRNSAQSIYPGKKMVRIEFKKTGHDSDNNT